MIFRFKHPASILLVSMLAVSAFSLLITVALTELNLTQSFIQLNREESSLSLYAAEACLEESLYRLEAQSGFTGTQITIDAQTTCTSTVNGLELNIDVTNGSFQSHYEASLSAASINTLTNYSLIEWKEV